MMKDCLIMNIIMSWHHSHDANVIFLILWDICGHNDLTEHHTKAKQYSKSSFSYYLYVLLLLLLLLLFLHGQSVGLECLCCLDVSGVNHPWYIFLLSSFRNFFCGLWILQSMLPKCFHIYLIYSYIIVESGLIIYSSQMNEVMKPREVKSQGYLVRYIDFLLKKAFWVLNPMFFLLLRFF